MSDLSNSVIMPREDFYELTTTAFAQTPTLKERAVGTAHGLIICSGLTALIVAGTWGCTKAVDWLEERRLKRARTQQNLGK